MGPIGPMMTRVWTRIAREVIRDTDRGIGRRDDTYAHDYGGSVRMVDLQPALAEFDFEDEDQPGLKDILGV